MTRAIVLRWVESFGPKQRKEKTFDPPFRESRIQSIRFSLPLNSFRIRIDIDGVTLLNDVIDDTLQSIEFREPIDFKERMYVEATNLMDTSYSLVMTVVILGA